jgi:hypothetical protein
MRRARHVLYILNVGRSFQGRRSTALGPPPGRVRCHCAVRREIYIYMNA